MITFELLKFVVMVLCLLVILFWFMLVFVAGLGLSQKRKRVKRRTLADQVINGQRQLKACEINKLIDELLRLNNLLIGHPLVLFGVVTVMLLFLSAVGIYYFENEAQPEEFKSIFHSLWWAVATLTTVGYGDVYPITIGGRIFTFFILMIGLGIVAVPAGLLASALSKARMEDNKENQ